MSFLFKQKLPTSAKATIKIGDKIYYHRKNVSSDLDRDEAVTSEKKKGRLVKVKLFDKKMGDGALSFTVTAIYSTK